MKEERYHLNKEIDFFRSKVHDLEKRNRNLALKNRGSPNERKVEELRVKNNHLESEISRQTRENRSLKDQYQRMVNEFNKSKFESIHSRSEFKNSRQATQIHNQKIRSLEERITILRREISQKNSKISQMGASSTEVNSLKMQIESLVSEKSEWSMRIQRLEEEIAQVRNAKKNNDRMIRTLNDLLNDRDQNTRDYLDKIEALQNQIKNMGGRSNVKYSKRVFNSNLFIPFYSWLDQA